MPDYIVKLIEHVECDIYVEADDEEGAEAAAEYELDAKADFDIVSVEIEVPISRPIKSA